MAAIQKCGFQLVEDPLYSPDMAPSDYHQFPKIKQELAVHHFASDDDVMNAVDHFLMDQNYAFYSEGTHLLHDRWTMLKTLLHFIVWNWFLFTLGHGHFNHPCISEEKQNKTKENII